MVNLFRYAYDQFSSYHKWFSIQKYLFLITVTEFSGKFVRYQIGAYVKVHSLCKDEFVWWRVRLCVAPRKCSELDCDIGCVHCSWNRLDMAIVILSIIGIILEEIKSGLIPINPTIIRAMRVLRIARGWLVLLNPVKPFVHMFFVEHSELICRHISQ